MPTTIEWTDETWNPVTGCEKISPGCTRCYAKTLHDMRHQAYLRGSDVPEQYAEPFEVVKCHPDRLDIPLHWRAPRLCFVNSMSDLYHEDVPFAFIDLTFSAMAIAEHITFQILTKRGDRMLDYYQGLEVAAGAWEAKWLTDHPHGQREPFTCSNVLNLRQLASAPERGGMLGKAFHRPWPLPNVWPGVSVEDRKHLYRLDQLREIPAPVRMVSFEPLLEDLGKVNLQGIGWAIVGGESGDRARPMHPEWARSLRDQCLAAGVPFFFKQWGAFGPPTTAYSMREKKNAGQLVRYTVACSTARNEIGQTSWHAYPANAEDGPGRFEIMRPHKRADGRELDGREWNEFPKSYPGHQVVRLKKSSQLSVLSSQERQPA